MLQKSIIFFQHFSSPEQMMVTDEEDDDFGSQNRSNNGRFVRSETLPTYSARTHFYSRRQRCNYNEMQNFA